MTWCMGGVSTSNSFIHLAWTLYSNSFFQFPPVALLGIMVWLHHFNISILFLHRTGYWSGPFLRMASPSPILVFKNQIYSKEWKNVTWKLVTENSLFGESGNKTKKKKKNKKKEQWWIIWIKLAKNFAIFIFSSKPYMKSTFDSKNWTLFIFELVMKPDSYRNNSWCMNMNDTVDILPSLMYARMQCKTCSIDT